MKKTLLALVVTAVFCLGINSVVNAAAVKVTKPTVTVNTSKEESAVSKKLTETQNKIDKARKDAEAQRAANKKAAEAKKAETNKKIEQAKKDAEAKRTANEKAAKAYEKGYKLYNK